MDKKINEELKNKLSDYIENQISYDIDVLINRSIYDFYKKQNIDVQKHHEVLFFNEELKESILLKILKLK